MDETNKRRALVAAMVASAIPALFFMSIPATSDPLSTWELYFSATLGYFGLVMLLWMYILGNKSVIGIFLKDRAPVIKIHTWLGKYGTLLIFLHPLLATFSYGENLLYSFIPHIGSNFERHVTLGRIAFLTLIIIWITSALIRGRIRYRPWKYIHFLSYIALPFALLHAPLIGTQILSHPALKGYYFTLVVVFFIFTATRISSLFNLDKTAYHLSRNALIGPDTYLATFSPVSERLRVPHPGQYIYVKLGFVSEDHPFSVVNHDKQTGDITIAYRTYGQFTQLLSQLPATATVYLGGPYGSFTHNFSSHDTPVVFVAGGIGVTPFMSHLFANHASQPVLIYANRSQASSLFLSPLRTKLQDNLIELYSDEPGRPAEHVSKDVFRTTFTDVASRHYYICGPAPMITQCKKILEKLGVPDSQIHSEEFMF